MCQQLTEGLEALTSDDPFSNAPTQQNSAKGRGMLTHQASLPAPFHSYPHSQANHHMLSRQHTSPASQSNFIHLVTNKMLIILWCKNSIGI